MLSYCRFDSYLESSQLYWPFDLLNIKPGIGVTSDGHIAHKQCMIDSPRQSHFARFPSRVVRKTLRERFSLSINIDCNGL